MQKMLIAFACLAVQQSPALMFGYHKDYMGGTVRLLFAPALVPVGNLIYLCCYTASG